MARIGHTSRTGKEYAPREMRVCADCGEPFRVLLSKKQKYCSKECRSKHMGGYRIGQGSIVSGYYKGIYCGSSYELAWVIYRLDHSQSVKRFDGYITDGQLKYFPDFIDGNKIIEIKGSYYDKNVENKTALAVSKGYDIDVLYKDNLKEMFEYVKTTYSYKHIKELFDKYKPTYSFICSCCNKEFSLSSNKKRTTKIVTDRRYCSRVCAGKGHTGRIAKSYTLIGQWFRPDHPQ